jgi:Tol biopolymer transport system component
MATGSKAFAGETQASVIGSIMHGQPQPASTIQPMTPPALDRVIHSCLAKDPEDRWQTAHDVKLQLQWIAEGGSVVGLPAPVAARRKSRERLAWAAFGVAVIAAAVSAAAWIGRAPEAPMQSRFEIPIAPDLSFVGRPRISPDGRTIAVYATDPTGSTKIWLRHMASLEMTPLSGTDSTADTRPIWSPDSRSIAFFAEGKLKRISVDGGPAQTVCDALGADGSWSSKGDILFDGGPSDPIRMVPAGGGVPQDVMTADAERGISSVAWPEWLPDGRRFLFLSWDGEGQSRLMLGEVGSTEPTELMLVSSRVQYVDPGFLLHVRDETLVAHPFDPKSAKFTGDPKPIADDVSTVATGHAPFTASQNGTLLYMALGGSRHRLVWKDRSGRELGTIGEPAEYGAFALAPDPGLAVVDLFDAQTDNRDLWIHDLERGVASRFTFDQASDRNPVWSPDGSRIVYSSSRSGGSRDLYIKDASGAGQAELLMTDPDQLHPGDWSRDGRYLAVMKLSSQSDWDIFALPMDGSGEAFPAIQTPFGELLPMLSPDGRWVTYMSDQSGRMEVYVQRFPEPGGKWQVSTAGGGEPVWSADGSEIFYIDAAQNLVSVKVTTGETFKAGLPEILFEARLVPALQRNRYAVSEDGQRFLLLLPLETQANPPMTVVQNWPVSLER